MRQIVVPYAIPRLTIETGRILASAVVREGHALTLEMDKQNNNQHATKAEYIYLDSKLADSLL